MLHYRQYFYEDALLPITNENVCIL